MPRLHDENNDSRVLPVTTVQYTMLQRWAAGNFTGDLQNPPTPPLLPDALDRAALESCSGGAFYPWDRSWPPHVGSAHVWRTLPDCADHETRTDHGGERAAMAGRLRGVHMGDAGIHRMVAGPAPGSRAAREARRRCSWTGRAASPACRMRPIATWSTAGIVLGSSGRGRPPRAPCSSRPSGIRRCRAAS